MWDNFAPLLPFVSQGAKARFVLKCTKKKNLLSDFKIVGIFSKTMKCSNMLISQTFLLPEK